MAPSCSSTSENNAVINSMVVVIDSSAPGRVARFRPAWRRCMAMARRPTSTIRLIDLQATNTIGYQRGGSAWPLQFSQSVLLVCDILTRLVTYLLGAPHTLATDGFIGINSVISITNRMRCPSALLVLVYVVGLLRHPRLQQRPDREHALVAGVVDGEVQRVPGFGWGGRLVGHRGLLVRVVRP